MLSNSSIKKVSSKRSKHRISKSSMTAYLGVFLLVIAVVSIGYQPPQQLTALADTSSTSNRDALQTMSTVDELVATNVAANIAQTAGLPVAANVSNRSQSMEAESLLVTSEDTVVSKPQIVEPTQGSREITTYTAVAGDTVAKIAKKYGISANTIKWANDLASDEVSKGTKLKILPVDGILYTVKKGDTAASIAKQYNANAAELITFNDLDLEGVSKGDQLIIPSGILPEDERPDYVESTASNNSSSSSRYSYSGGTANVNTATASVGNRYAFGNCTWYVYERRQQLGKPVGSFWGNASTWAAYARAAGYKVNGTPAVGAVMQDSSGYYGHVAVVESVDPGKSITITEMNAYRFGGGFNIIGRGQISWGQAANGYYQYIH